MHNKWRETRTFPNKHWSCSASGLVTGSVSVCFCFVCCWLVARRQYLRARDVLCAISVHRSQDTRQLEGDVYMFRAGLWCWCLLCVGSGAISSSLWQIALVGLRSIGTNWIGAQRFGSFHSRMNYYTAVSTRNYIVNTILHVVAINIQEYIIRNACFCCCLAYSKITPYRYRRTTHFICYYKFDPVT